MAKSKLKNFTLSEMFVLYALSDKVEFVSHKIGINKQINLFSENKDFCRLLDLTDIIKKKYLDIKTDYLPKVAKLQLEIKPFIGKKLNELPQEAKDKIQELEKINKEVIEKQRICTEAESKEFDKLTENDSEYSFKFETLAAKAVKSFLEAKGLTMEDLKKHGFTNEQIECLFSIYEKI